MPLLFCHDFFFYLPLPVSICNVSIDAFIKVVYQSREYMNDASGVEWPFPYRAAIFLASFFQPRAACLASVKNGWRFELEKVSIPSNLIWLSNFPDRLENRKC